MIHIYVCVYIYIYIYIYKHTRIMNMAMDCAWDIFVAEVKGNLQVTYDRYI